MNALKETISAIFPHIENVNQYNSSELSLEPKSDFPITVELGNNNSMVVGRCNLGWDVNLVFIMDLLLS